MVQGAITEEDTEAIINPTDNKFSLDGAISKQIVKKGGQQISSDCAKLGTLKDVEMTKAEGQLKCKHLVHVLYPQDSGEFCKIIMKVLPLVDKKQLHSLSIPFIGTGRRNLQRDEVADNITLYVVIKAEREYFKSLKLIRLVGFTVVEKALFKNKLYKWIK